MSPVPSTLGTHMATRRNELNISQAKAAKAAGVSRTTWRTWEADEGVPEEFNRSLIERTLHWERGSTTAALAGGTPTPLAVATVTPLPPRDDLDELPPDDEFVRELRAMDLPAAYKDTLIREYWSDKKREAANLQARYRRIARAAES